MVDESIGRRSSLSPATTIAKTTAADLAASSSRISGDCHRVSRRIPRLAAGLQKNIHAGHRHRRRIACALLICRADRDWHHLNVRTCRIRRDSATEYDDNRQSAHHLSIFTAIPQEFFKYLQKLGVFVVLLRYGMG